MELDAGGWRGAVPGAGCAGMAGRRTRTARPGPWEPWHSPGGISGSGAGHGLVPRTRGPAGSPGLGAGITGWRWMEPPIAPDAVSAPGQLLSPEGWTD